MKERIQKLLKAGANVVLTTKGIDDMSLKACIYQLVVIMLTFSSEVAKFLFVN